MAEGSPRQRWVRIAAAAAFVLIVGAAVVLSTLRENMAVRSPMSRTRVALALAVADQPDRLAGHARRVAATDPMQAAAFVMAGLDELRRNPAAFDRTQQLMLAAAARQPAFEAPQVWLAADYARRGDYRRSLALFDRVLSLGSDQAEQLQPVLALLVANPASRGAVVERLQTYPVWRSGLLIKAITAQSLPRPLIDQLLAGPAPASYARSLELERQAYLTWLNENGSAAEAHALYRRYAGLSDAQLLFDPDFRRADPYPPFGWVRTDLAEDYAQRVERGGQGWMMRLHGSGKRNTVLLEQTAALPAGKWRIELTGRDGGLAPPKAMQLALRCRGAEQDLRAVSLGALQSAESRVALDLVVPAGCPLQRLALVSAEDEAGASEIELFAIKAVRQ